MRLVSTIAFLGLVFLGISGAYASHATTPPDPVVFGKEIITKTLACFLKDDAEKVATEAMQAMQLGMNSESYASQLLDHFRMGSELSCSAVTSLRSTPQKTIYQWRGWASAKKDEVALTNWSLVEATVGEATIYLFMLDKYDGKVPAPE
jgi:hypothetical protein